MSVPANLVERARELADLLADPDVDDAGLALNSLVRELRASSSISLRDHEDTVREAMALLGPTGERVVSWLTRHVDAMSTQEERARVRFWSSMLESLTTTTV